jgi:hypothetical protein
MSLPPIDPTLEAQHIVAMHEEFKKAVLHELGQTKGEVSDLKDQIQELKEGVGILLEILSATKGGIKFLGWLGVFAKWVGGIVGAIVAVWSFVRAIKGS